MKCFYDFHIHSALSPCADDDMTPADIVNMAALKNLDVIAISDHNSVKNCNCAIEYSKKNGGPLVIAAMELTCEEDIHILCLFKNIFFAQDFENYIYKDKLKIKNKPDIFGQQCIYDINNNLSGYEEYLLTTATAVPCYKAAEIVKGFGGVAVPAHINKDSNSLISILGGIDKSMGFNTVELYSNNKEISKYSNDYNVLLNSDAHSLGHISEAENFIEIEEISSDCIIEYLSKKQQ